MRKTVASPHPDGYTLLLLAAGELDELGAKRVERHVESCPACRRALLETRWLDRELASRRDAVFGAGRGEGLPPGDPFAERPRVTVRSASRYGFADPSFALRWAGEARNAVALRDGLLSAGEEALAGLLESLDLATLRSRYGIGFALEEGCRRIAEGALRFRPLAVLTLRRLEREKVLRFSELTAGDVSEAEFAYPLIDLAARADLLDGVVCNWTGEYDRGGRCLLSAWTRFGQGAGSDRSLAFVEIHESQRRAFCGDGPGAVVLALRALGTCEELESFADVARAHGAAGVALGAVNRHEEAIEHFRAAASAFADLGLWNGFGSAVNCLGSTLLDLGRADEARREYARALKITAKGDRAGNHAFLRLSLGRAAFRSGAYPQAASAFRAAAALFAKLGMLADEAVAGLHLAECLARSGRAAEARECVRGIEERLGQVPGLDGAILRDFRDQLSGEKPDFEAVTALRDRAEEAIRLRVVRTG